MSKNKKTKKEPTEADSKLEQLFKGGVGTISSSDGQDEATPQETSAPTTTHLSGVSTSTGSNISGSRTQNISGI